MKFKHWLGLCGLALTVSINAHAAVEVDAHAPDFSLQNELGEAVSLSDFKGKYVVLEWTNHECPYVQKHYSSNNMQGLQQAYAAKEVIWLSIVSSAPGKQGYIDGQQAMQLTKERNAKPSHVLLDPEGTVGKLYAAKTTPHMYIIDPAGTLRYNGAIDSIKSANPADISKADNYLDMGLSSLLSGGAVANKVTPPYGCSIKYKS
jgi:peroxiredoxin